MARPTSYTKALGIKCCQQIAQGRSVDSMGKVKGLPTGRTVFRWLANEGAEYDEFRQLYARAREMRADARFESMQTLADEIKARTVAPDVGRVLMDIKKFQIVKENRSKYGDALTVQGNKAAPVVVESRYELSREQLLAIAASAAKKPEDPNDA